MFFQLTILGLATLIAVGILLHHPSKTLGVPSLLIFMGVGLLFGNGEFNFIYDNLAMTSLVGGTALNVIVFVGGLNTSNKNIKAAWKEGGVLSTVGVLLTTLIFAIILFYITDFNFITSLLLAAVVSSTDAAAVFSILESKKLKLKEKTDTILEFESATNDPVALLMVIILTDYIMSTSGIAPTFTEISLTLLQQIVGGAAIGFIIGKLCVFALNKIKLEEYGLIAVFILAIFIITVILTDLISGNELIAVYIAGVIIGNQLKRGAEVNKHFFSGISWLAQSLMFVILGLQLFPQNLITVFSVSVLPALLLIFIARPLAVQICYLPFTKVSWRKRLFISSIGLKGATPIVFGLIPAAAGVEGALEMLHMIFFIVLFSIFIQGGALEFLANKLALNTNKK
jgi:cell volume regulation protein A